MRETDELVDIEPYLFASLSKLEVLVNPRTRSIGEMALAYFSTLKNINIPPRVTSIDECAFLDCSKSMSNIIGPGAASVGGCAFVGCSSLRNIDIPREVTSIDELAFHGCSSLQSINIPQAITSIGPDAFRGCSLALALLGSPNLLKLQWLPEAKRYVAVWLDGHYTPADPEDSDSPWT